MVGGKVTQFLRLHEVCLWNVEPQPWWEATPGLMALYPLCHHVRTATQAISYAADAITMATPDSIVRADLLTTLAIFGKLAYRRLDVVNLIGREHMKESPLYEEIKDEGRLETRQADVLAVLEDRFGNDATARFGNAVNSVTNLSRLRRLLRLASRCASVDEFQRGLRNR
jgi:predicted transposase YdaD